MQTTIDHLKRVKYKGMSYPSSNLVKANFEFSLFDDVVVRMKDKNGNISWFLYCFHKIIKIVDKRKIDYIGTMSLDKVGISILPRYYKHVASY